LSRKSGILPEQAIRTLIKDGAVKAANPMNGEDGLPTQIQPASLDLRLSAKAYRLRASFLPGDGRSVKEAASSLVMHEIDLSGGAVLETGCVYLVPLQESLELPKSLAASANPKSSTGRLDVFTRVIRDGATAFDNVSAGYSGPLYVEIAPRTFSILVRPGDRLVQMRFRRGALKELSTQTVSIDLSDYILASKEAVSIPQDMAAEMAPIAPEIGEFRAHYAGFFDPGFGVDVAGGAGSRAVLEVRGRDVPFILRDGQPVAKLVFEAMSETPTSLYGQNGSHYQAQGLRLSKHFVD